jgi:hypothetical protein
MIRAAALAVLLISATSAFAKQDDINKIALAEGDFAAQRAQIEADLADGKTYAEISRNDRAKVRESLDRIGATLAGVESIDALNPDAKARVFNDQELVNQILTAAAADSRLICERTAKTGSNRKITTCETVAERNRRRELDQDNLQKMQRGINGAVSN